MSAKAIKTQPNRVGDSGLELGGWLDGRETYLWIGVNGICLGTLEGHKLARLAKAIVRELSQEEQRE